MANGSTQLVFERKKEKIGSVKAEKGSYKKNFNLWFVKRMDLDMQKTFGSIFSFL